MRWRAMLVLAAAVGSLLVGARPAAACSAGPGFEPRNLTQLLVLGRVRSLEIGPRTTMGFHEALITLDVLRVHRGAAGPVVRFVDVASVSVDGGVASFSGGSGACGTVDRGPTGRYALIALARGDDGRWYANRLFGAVFTDTLDDAAYRWLLQRHGVPVPFLVIGPIWGALRDPAFAP